MLVNGLFHNQLYNVYNIRLQAAQVKSRTFSNGWLLFICYLLIPCSVFWGKLSVCIAVGDDEKDDQVDDQNF